MDLLHLKAVLVLHLKLVHPVILEHKKPRRDVAIRVLRKQHLVHLLRVPSVLVLLPDGEHRRDRLLQVVLGCPQQNFPRRVVILVLLPLPPHFQMD